MSQKNVGPEKFWGNQILDPILDLKKFWSRKFGVPKLFEKRFLGPKKNVGSKMLVQKFWVHKFFESKDNWFQKNEVQQNFGFKRFVLKNLCPKEFWV